MNSTFRTKKRYIIKHFATTGITPIDTLKFIERSLAICSRRLVIKWHERFREGEFNMNNLPRKGRPFRTKHDKPWIRDIVKTDRRKTVREISDTTGMCANVVYRTIIQDLSM